MSKVTIWIRVEDEKKWEAIKDRPSWLHKMINGSYIQVPDILDARERGVDPKSVLITDYCDHGQVKGKCLWKGCKYA